MKELKNLFLKNIVLIFIVLFYLVNFDNLFVQKVYASPWDDWIFKIDTDTKEIDIDDGTAGFLGKDSNKTKGDAWNLILNRYKVFIVGIGGFASLAIVLIALFLFTKLSAEGTNPQARAQTVKWIGSLLIAAALLGSITVIFSYSYGLFR